MIERLKRIKLLELCHLALEIFFSAFGLSCAAMSGWVLTATPQYALPWGISAILSMLLARSMYQWRGLLTKVVEMGSMVREMTSPQVMTKRLSPFHCPACGGDTMDKPEGHILTCHSCKTQWVAAIAPQSDEGFVMLKTPVEIFPAGEKNKKMN